MTVERKRRVRGHSADVETNTVHETTPRLPNPHLPVPTIPCFPTAGDQAPLMITTQVSWVPTQALPSLCRPEAWAGTLLDHASHKEGGSHAFYLPAGPLLYYEQCSLNPCRPLSHPFQTKLSPVSSPHNTPTDRTSASVGTLQAQMDCPTCTHKKLSFHLCSASPALSP